MINLIDASLFRIAATKTVGVGTEREHVTWEEQEQLGTDFYNGTLWEPETPADSSQRGEDFPEGVFVSQVKEVGLSIVARGRAEVFVRNTNQEVKLLGGEEPMERNDGVQLWSGQAVKPGGEAKVIFSQPGQIVDLVIKVGDRTIKQVQITNLK